MQVYNKRSSIPGRQPWSCHRHLEGIACRQVAPDGSLPHLGPGCQSRMLEAGRSGGGSSTPRQPGPCVEKKKKEEEEEEEERGEGEGKRGW